MSKHSEGFHKQRTEEEHTRYRQFGAFVQEKRWQLDFTQETIARLTGLSQPQLSRIENGRHLPRSRVTLDKLADALALEGDERHKFFELAGYVIDSPSRSTELDRFLERDFIAELINSAEKSWYELSDARKAKVLLDPLTSIPIEGQAVEMLSFQARAVLLLADVAGWEGRLFTTGGVHSLGTQVLEIGQKLNSPIIQAQGLYQIGTTYGNVGCYEDAQRLWRLASDLQLPQHVRFNIERGLLIAAGELRDENEVRELVLKSLRAMANLNYEQFNKAMDPDRGQFPYNRLEVIGRAYMKLGKYDEAGRRLREALDYYRPGQNPFTYMILLTTLCEYYRLVGDIATSNFFKRLATEHGEKYGFSHQLGRLAKITGAMI